MRQARRPPPSLAPIPVTLTTSPPFWRNVPDPRAASARGLHPRGPLLLPLVCGTNTARQRLVAFETCLANQGTWAYQPYVPRWKVCTDVGTYRITTIRVYLKKPRAGGLRAIGRLTGRSARQRGLITASRWVDTRRGRVPCGWFRGLMGYLLGLERVRDDCLFSYSGPGATVSSSGIRRAKFDLLWHTPTRHGCPGVTLSSSGIRRVEDDMIHCRFHKS